MGHAPNSLPGCAMARLLVTEVHGCLTALADSGAPWVTPLLASVAIAGRQLDERLAALWVNFARGHGNG